MLTTSNGPANLRRALDLADRTRVRFHPDAHPESYNAVRYRERAVIALGDAPGGVWDLMNRHRVADLIGSADTDTRWMLATLAGMLKRTPSGSALDRAAQRAEWFGSGRTLADALQTAADTDRLGHFLGTTGTQLVADAAHGAGLDVTPRTPHAHGALAIRQS